MLTLKETLTDQNNLQQLCADRPFEMHEIFFANAFYGNDYIVKTYAKFPRSYYLKAVLPHGITIGDSIWKPEIQSPLPVIFSFSEHLEAKYIDFINENAINKVVIPSASTFLYLLELLKDHPKNQTRNGTIFFPAHSTHHVIAQADWERLAEELVNLEDKFQPVTVCIYWKDFELGRHIPFQRRGMRIVSAGHMFDKNFLFRFYHLCSTHCYAASNELGSHLFFSIKSGCSYFHLDTVQSFYTAESQEILDRDLAPKAPAIEMALKSMFSSPKHCITTEQMEIVDSYLGTKYLKSPKELQEQILYAEDLFQKAEKLKQITSISNCNYKVLPRIIIDGVCFQLAQTGIAKIWKYLLQEWLNSDFAKHITIIDRDGTAPKYSDFTYYTLPDYDYNNIVADQEMIQQVCDRECADLFISTHHTMPITTPSIFMVNDLIPEIMGWDLNHPIWKEKHYSIKQAAACIALSENAAHNLVKFFPNILLESVVVAKNGIDRITFSVASQEEINHFKTKHGITKPYFMIVSGGSGFQNSILFFQAFAQLASSCGFDIVCTGDTSVLETELKNYISGSVVHQLQLDSKKLAAAYSGAIALVYPSKYEAYYLPVLEALACGCPVIAGDNPSILELVGEAAIYVSEDDVNGMINALCDVQKPSVRRALIAAGLKESKKFSLSKMAKTISTALIDFTLMPLKLKKINFIIFPDWSQAEEIISLNLERVIKVLATHNDKEQATLLIDTNNISNEDAELLLSGVTMNLLMQEDIDVTEGLQISLIEDLGEIQWEALLPRIQARIILEHENKVAIARAKAENIPLRDLKSLSTDL